MVKLYCPKCQDVYTPKSSRHHHTDGAYFGTGFPHMLFMVHPEYRPKRPANQFSPRQGILNISTLQIIKYDQYSTICNVYIHVITELHFRLGCMDLKYTRWHMIFNIRQLQISKVDRCMDSVDMEIVNDETKNSFRRFNFKQVN